MDIVIGQLMSRWQSGSTITIRDRRNFLACLAQRVSHEFIAFIAARFEHVTAAGIHAINSPVFTACVSQSSLRNRETLHLRIRAEAISRSPVLNLLPPIVRVPIKINP